ncbi:MotA/TolQ/ExbB proton channel family protein [Croceicoccus marinus]|jgi:chemotaxis protein MotA|uniref:MotA/TolQ/ExbB proton channel family protein n=1 Tax=Croceicoccus marinus TaxID=450378 RepID=A0A7G6VR02_9SPHN|nr:MotA/TolQ/ExbB proton channel family protein [Croceicoccus marinus]QNE04167.1 MotA/TolQ/ExbB proton channel family protein [Croceicoccus marinus]
MDFNALIDPVSAVVVVGGTMLATVLRAGLGECRATWATIRHLASREFDEDALRSDLARMVQDVRIDGLVRTEPYYFRDRASQQAARAMIEARSIPLFHKQMTRFRARRVADNRRAFAVLAMAAENAPAFGLAGTLLALSQLPADPGQGMNAALAGAVLTTLYGVLLAQLVLTPLAEAIRRSGEAEEQARDELMRWTAWQLEGAVVHPLPLPGAAEAEAA